MIYLGMKVLKEQSDLDFENSVKRYALPDACYLLQKHQNSSWS